MASILRLVHCSQSTESSYAIADAIPGAITRHEDNSGWMRRTEIVCSKCGGHLGHVFKGEGFNNPSKFSSAIYFFLPADVRIADERHCVNSISLNFDKEDAAAKA